MAFALSLNGAQAGIFTSNNGLLEIGDEAFAVRFPPAAAAPSVQCPTRQLSIPFNTTSVPFTRLSVTRLSVPFISYIQPLKHIISTLHTITGILDPIQTEDKDLTCREFVCAKSVTSAVSAGSVAALQSMQRSWIVAKLEVFAPTTLGPVWVGLVAHVLACGSICSRCGCTRFGAPRARAAPPSPASLLCALATHAGAVCVRRAADIPPA